MIVNMLRMDVVQSPHKHIVFAVNTAGRNYVGFSALVVNRYWPQIGNFGPQELGKSFSYTDEESGITFHAVVCHHLNHGANNWVETPRIVEEFLNKLSVLLSEEIAVVQIGGGPEGQLDGADTFEIMGGMARSNKRVVVYIF